MSASPPRADMLRVSTYVRKVPLADVATYRNVRRASLEVSSGESAAGDCLAAVARLLIGAGAVNHFDRNLRSQRKFSRDFPCCLAGRVGLKIPLSGDAAPPSGCGHPLIRPCILTSGFSQREPRCPRGLPPFARLDCPAAIQGRRLINDHCCQKRGQGSPSE